MQVNKTEAPTAVYSAVWREELELSWNTFLSQHNVSVVAKLEAVLRTADVCHAVKYFMMCVCIIKRETDDKHQFQYFQMSADNFSFSGFTMLDTALTVSSDIAVFGLYPQAFRRRTEIRTQ